ncbi:MAG: DUF2095 family protein [Promethearchaeota archaeon]
MFDKKEFKKRFPVLSKEIETKEMTMPIDEVKDQSSSAPQDERPSTIKTIEETIPMDILELDEPDYWRGHDPKAEDFIRRATNPEEAIEIIDYLLKREELSPEKAEKLRTILKTEGLRAFGPHKRPGYYFDERMRQSMKKSMKKSPLSKG